MKFLKLVALGYVVKTALFAAAWLFIPDLPQRTVALVRDSWAWATHRNAPPPELPAAAVAVTDAQPR